MEELIQKLKELFASNYALYLKAQYFHWNVEGPNFPQYHEFFGSFYEEVGGSIDKMAEHIRAVDAYTPGSFARFLELSAISGQDSIIEPMAMFRELLADNEQLLTMLIDVYKRAEAVDRLGLSNFLQDRIEAHRVHSWMLRATLK